MTTDQSATTTTATPETRTAPTTASRPIAERHLFGPGPCNPYPEATLALANLLVTGGEEGEVSAAAVKLADWCHALVERTALPLDILGPAPAALARIKERWRWHVVVRGSAEDVGRFVRYAAPRVGKGTREVRVSIDRDPVSLL